MLFIYWSKKCDNPVFPTKSYLLLSHHMRMRMFLCVGRWLSALVSMCLSSHVPHVHPDSISTSQSWWLFLKQDYFQPIPLMHPDRELAGGDICVIFLLYALSFFAWSEWTCVVCQYFLEECVWRWDSLFSMAQLSIWPDWIGCLTKFLFSLLRKLGQVRLLLWTPRAFCA